MKSHALIMTMVKRKKFIKIHLNVNSSVSINHYIVDYQYRTKHFKRILHTSTKLVHKANNQTPII